MPFFDDPINGIHWELAWIPRIPSPRQAWASYRALAEYARNRDDLADTVFALGRQAHRRLPRR